MSREGDADAGSDPRESSTPRRSGGAATTYSSKPRCSGPHTARTVRGPAPARSSTAGSGPLCRDEGAAGWDSFVIEAKDMTRPCAIAARFPGGARWRVIEVRPVQELTAPRVIDAGPPELRQDMATHKVVKTRRVAHGTERGTWRRRRSSPGCVDQLSRERRDLPWELVGKAVHLPGASAGPQTLSGPSSTDAAQAGDLSRDVHHPGQNRGVPHALDSRRALLRLLVLDGPTSTASPCHLNHRDITMAAVSLASLPEAGRLQENGWAGAFRGCRHTESDFQLRLSRLIHW